MTSRICSLDYDLTLELEVLLVGINGTARTAQESTVEIALHGAAEV